MSKPTNHTEHRESPGFRIAMKVLGTLHRWLYRASDGRLGKTFFGSPILLLTTTGRKTGRSRTWPLTYLHDEGDRFIVIASNGGQPKHPAWYLNLRANPHVIVQHGEQTRAMIAQAAEGDERARLWSRVVEEYPAYADYQRKTERQIPVVVLRQDDANCREDPLAAT
jgi:deazaflavin-dependent oxidoreductase (nitroreductase family)